MATVSAEHKRSIGNGKTTIKRPSEHCVSGKFYGFKAMIGGQRFYFGVDLGITSATDKDAKRANEAAAIYRREFERLELAGVKAWTPEAIATAKSTARMVLIGAAPVATTASTTPYPTVTAAEAALPTSFAPTSLHKAVDAFLAEQKQRLETNDICENTYKGVEARLAAVKRAHADVSLTSIGRNELRAICDYWKKRPTTDKGTPASINWVNCILAVLRPLFVWAKKYQGWRAWEDWQDVFEFDKRKALTIGEQRAIAEGRRIGADPTKKKQYTLEELAIVYANAPKRLRLYMLLVLNCGMGAGEISTLCRWHVQIPSNLDGLKEKSIDDKTTFGKEAVIDRQRNKTGVQARWVLWEETTTLLAAAMNESTAEGAPYALTTDSEELAVLTEDGYPVVHRSGPNRAKTDSVAQLWNRCLNRPSVKGKVRQLGFYKLRGTGAQYIRDIAGLETAMVYAAQSTLDPSGRKSVNEAFYTDRSHADFDRVASALVTMRQKLQPMFDAKTETPTLPKARAGFAIKKGKAA